MSLWVANRLFYHGCKTRWTTHSDRPRSHVVGSHNAAKTLKLSWCVVQKRHNSLVLWCFTAKTKHRNRTIRVKMRQSRFQNIHNLHVRITLCRIMQAQTLTWLFTLPLVRLRKVQCKHSLNRCRAMRHHCPFQVKERCVLILYRLIHLKKLIYQIY